MSALERPRRCQRPPLPWQLRWQGLLLTGILVVSYLGSEGELSGLFRADALHAMGDFAGGFWPPAHSAEFLGSLVRPLAETIAIAFLGMSLALALALPLSFFAVSPEALAATDQSSRLRLATHVGSRMVLNLMRSIPELIWALIFVRAVGLGPVPGVLAIGVGYAGVLGKVFSEIFESVPRGPAQSLMASGSTPSRAFVFGILPGAGPMMASYALYRLDCALRASAILGIVGAGGLGMQIELSIKMLAHDEVAAQVIILFALVALLDLMSQWARRRLHGSTNFLPQGRSALWTRGAALAAWGLAALGAAALLDVSPRELFSPESLKNAGEFLGGLFPPEFDSVFLRGILPAVGQTLAVSVLGTALAAGAGLLLAYPSAYRLHALGTPLLHGHLWASRARLALAWGARGVANLGRTLPELIWALVFIFAVGLGPFAGALALAVHTAGVLSRLYSEALEEIPVGPYQALRESGSSHFAAVLFGVYPQAFPQLVAYTLYRWEVNIRASAVLGVVGAGGIGTALYLSLAWFNHQRTLTLVLIILVMVTVVDFFSGWLRRQVAASGTAPAASMEAW